MLEFQREYICAKCKYKINVIADLEQKYVITPPKHCTNPQLCKSTTLILNDKLDIGSNCKDYQEVKIQVEVLFVFPKIPLLYIVIRSNCRNLDSEKCPVQCGLLLKTI